MSIFQDQDQVQAPSPPPSPPPSPVPLMWSDALKELVGSKVIGVKFVELGPEAISRYDQGVLLELVLATPDNVIKSISIASDPMGHCGRGEDCPCEDNLCLGLYRMNGLFIFPHETTSELKKTSIYSRGEDDS